MTATNSESIHVRLPAEIQQYVADGKISIHAAWLYGLLLSHVNYQRGDAHVWPSRSTLATRMGMEKAKSVDRYLKQLETAGLIEKETRKSDKRGNESNRYTLMVVSWPKEHRDPSPQLGTTPVVQPGTSLAPGWGHELEQPQLHEDELNQRSDQSGTTSDRFAHSGGDEDSDDFASEWDLPRQRQPSTAEKLTRKRVDDRELFLKLIEAHRLRSDGSTFNEGVFDVDLFYDGFRKVKIGNKKIGFPGAYIESMCTDGYGRGIEDWLLSIGLEPV
ncbi:helix-turn-helix domain-containing protein [Micromonospora arborensis]|uniref:helix-turn-helix domain-containing protein n=1 Tax=Micromonospora arborensis TaxID=2116518 RepID=UPI0033D3748A